MARLRYESLQQSWDVELESGEMAGDDHEVLFQGLIQMKEEQGLYKLDESGIKLTQDGLFSYTFHLPASITVGDYSVDVYAFLNGDVIGIGKSDFSVSKGGLVWFLSLTAKTYAAVYAVLAVLIALAVGFCVSLVFKRKGAH